MSTFEPVVRCIPPFKKFSTFVDFFGDTRFVVAVMVKDMMIGREKIINQVERIGLI